MSVVVADTHSAIWYLSGSDRLSSFARTAMNEATANGDPIYMSAITLVEVVYLVEKGRLPDAALMSLREAISNSHRAFALVAVDEAIAITLQEIDRDTIPDMPDRIIAATARYLGLPLVSRDHKIRAANLHTIW